MLMIDDRMNQLKLQCVIVQWKTLLLIISDSVLTNKQQFLKKMCCFVSTIVVVNCVCSVAHVVVSALSKQLISWWRSNLPVCGVECFQPLWLIADNKKMIVDDDFGAMFAGSVTQLRHLKQCSCKTAAKIPPLFPHDWWWRQRNRSIALEVKAHAQHNEVQVN